MLLLSHQPNLQYIYHNISYKKKIFINFLCRSGSARFLDCILYRDLINQGGAAEFISELFALTEHPPPFIFPS